MKTNPIVCGVVIFCILVISCITREHPPNEASDQVEEVEISGEFSKLSPDNVLQIINLPVQMLPRSASKSFTEALRELRKKEPSRTVGDGSFGGVATTDRVYFSDLKGHNVAIIFGESFFVREGDRWSVYSASDIWQTLLSWILDKSIKIKVSKIEPIVLPLN